MRFRYSLRWLATGLCGLSLLAWGVFGAVALHGPGVAQAQDEDEEAAVEDAPAKPDAKPAGDAAAGGAPAVPLNESQLHFYYRALGVRYVVAFLFLSFTFVALIVMNVLTLRRSSIVPLQLVEAFEVCLNEKKYQEAYELAKNDDSFLGHVLSAGLGKLQSGYQQAIEAMQEVGEEETMKLEHRLGYIALIGTISPMVGLLGTVDGMVASFEVIAKSSAQPKPSELAAGIQMALITTLVGLWLAIPAIAIFGIMRNRMARLTLEVGILSEGLMARFQGVGGKKP
ncbi:MAG TPA: MotA/TolQ/ExbB proton channel family protein [Pirellulales bacterium]|nr:MotA/TolQ/ExbB proton channel family protein [Pirellulales bacterium]